MRRLILIVLGFLCVAGHAASTDDVVEAYLRGLHEGEPISRCTNIPAVSNYWVITNLDWAVPTNIIGTNSTDGRWFDYGVTNGWYTNDPIDVMIANNTLTNIIARLASRGLICAQFGHMFRDGKPGETGNLVYADYHPGVYYRTCQICGLCQSRSLTDWE